MTQTYVFTEYGGPETQEMRDLPTPDPGPSEIRIAVRAAGVNPVDWKIRAGYLKDVMPLDMPAGLGREAAGIVEAVGQDVDGFAVGDAVFGNVAPGFGGYAEQTILTAAVSAKKPTGVSFEDAATIPVAGATAYDAITQLALKPGQTLLINGIGGGVGVAAAQLARNGDVAVVGTASEGKRELVESLGAILVPYGDGVVARVREIMPDGVDAVLDLAGGQALRDVAELVNDTGTIVAAGDTGTAEEFGGAGVARTQTSATLSAVAELVATDKLDPHVVETYPLAEAGAALQAVETGHAQGKVVVTVG